MSNRNLFILGLTAVVMAALAVTVSKISSRPYARTSSSSAYLIQGLDPEQIAKITIASGKDGELVNLIRRGQNFVVANKGNYPALTDEINKLITTCLDIKTSELYTDNQANFKELGVTEADARLIVKFYKADSNLLTGIIIGKQRPKGSVGYIRRATDNSVYVMANQVPWIKNRPTDYVDQQLAKVKREDIESVMVSDLNEIYILKPHGTTLVLENIPEGRRLKEDIADRVFSALADLTFDDVNAESAAGSIEGLSFDRKYICQLKDSTVYAFWLAKDGDNWFTKCDAKFMDKTPVTKTQGEVESEAELKKKEAKLLARDAAEEFLEKHKDWIYQIHKDKAQDMTKPLAALVEDANKPAVEPNEIKLNE
jgi:malonyl CoA-acyl carrier protein transacylase